MEQNQKALISEDLILSKIYLMRGQKVMLDADLAGIYGVETKHLKRQVNRNIERFPKDFMFQLTKEEFELLRCQIGAFNGLIPKYLPFVFTEQGVAMLSGILSSKRAIMVNIQIMRVYTGTADAF